MATNRELRADLLKKLDVSKQQLSRLVARIKRLYGPMSTEEGTYVLAHLEGMDLTKYLEQVTVDRIRGMLPKTGAPTPNRASTRPKVTDKRTVRVGPNLRLVDDMAVDAMLPAPVAEDARRMASIYPKLYLFENSLRNVIIRVLSAKYGKDWWAKVPRPVRDTVTDRKATEARKPWHGKRGTHEIYYSDFGDLRDIITKNWVDFQDIFLTQTWITQRLDELEPPRNILAHNNPMSKQEEKRIDVYFNDWIALLNYRREVIP
jgi:hypothetical protein